MRIRPISTELLVSEVADAIVMRHTGTWTRVAVDGAPPTSPGTFADTLAQRLKLRGRPVVRISAADFRKPASLRFERGRYNADARYEIWLDDGGLTREALEPLKADGSGRIL